MIFQILIDKISGTKMDQKAYCGENEPFDQMSVLPDTVLRLSDTQPRGVQKKNYTKI